MKNHALLSHYQNRQDYQNWCRPILGFKRLRLYRVKPGYHKPKPQRFPEYRHGWLWKWNDEVE